MTPYIGMIHYSFAPRLLQLQLGAFIRRTKILTVFSLELQSALVDRLSTPPVRKPGIV